MLDTKRGLEENTTFNEKFGLFSCALQNLHTKKNVISLSTVFIDLTCDVEQKNAGLCKRCAKKTFIQHSIYYCLQSLFAFWDIFAFEVVKMFFWLYHSYVALSFFEFSLLEQQLFW